MVTIHKSRIVDGNILMDIKDFESFCEAQKLPILVNTNLGKNYTCWNGVFIICT